MLNVQTTPLSLSHAAQGNYIPTPIPQKDNGDLSLSPSHMLTHNTGLMASTTPDLRVHILTTAELPG